MTWLRGEFIEDEEDEIFEVLHGCLEDVGVSSSSINQVVDISDILMLVMPRETRS